MDNLTLVNNLHDANVSDVFSQLVEFATASGSQCEMTIYEEEGSKDISLLESVAIPLGVNLLASTIFTYIAYLIRKRRLLDQELETVTIRVNDVEVSLADISNDNVSVVTNDSETIITIKGKK